MKEGLLLKKHKWDELNYVKLRDRDIMMEEDDLVVILLVSFPLSFENYDNSFSKGKDCTTLEEVK